MTYLFNLDWDELPIELREKKIDQFIEAENKTINPKYVKCMEDSERRKAIKKEIKLHFPLYF